MVKGDTGADYRQDVPRDRTFNGGPGGVAGEYWGRSTHNSGLAAPGWRDESDLHLERSGRGMQTSYDNSYGLPLRDSSAYDPYEERRQGERYPY